LKRSRALHNIEESWTRGQGVELLLIQANRFRQPTIRSNTHRAVPCTPYCIHIIQRLAFTFMVTREQPRDDLLRAVRALFARLRRCIFPANSSLEALSERGTRKPKKRKTERTKLSFSGCRENQPQPLGFLDARMSFKNELSTLLYIDDTAGNRTYHHRHDLLCARKPFAKGGLAFCFCRKPRLCTNLCQQNGGKRSSHFAPCKGA